MKLGDKLKDYRNRCNLRQDEVALQMNVSRQTIGRWENNQNEPDIKTLSRLADVYQVTMDELVGNTSLSKNPAQAKKLHKEEKHLTKLSEMDRATIYIIGLVVLCALTMKGAAMCIPVLGFALWIMVTSIKKYHNRKLICLMEITAMISLATGISNIYFWLNM